MQLRVSFPHFTSNMRCNSKKDSLLSDLAAANLEVRATYYILLYPAFLIYHHMVASMTHDQVFLLLLEMQQKLRMHILYDGLPEICGWIIMHICTPTIGS